MNGRCKYLKITKDGESKSLVTWSCYKQFEERYLIQSCFLKRGECRYSNGPYPPDYKHVDAAEDLPVKAAEKTAEKG